MRKKGKLLLLLGMVCVLSLDFAGTSDAKKAHLSNEWYPSDPDKLKTKLQDLDQEAAAQYGAEVSGVKALIVPHAGLRYSGCLAAACFRLLDPKKVRRIIVLAPSHHAPFQGIILPSYSSYRLHSGVLPVDAKMVQELKKIGGAFTMVNHVKKDPHYKEHALEIQLPLIQKYAPRAKIVPLIVGSLDTKQMQQATQALKKYIDKETVVVVSSDFTHYGPRFNNVPFKNDALTFLKIRSLDNALLQPLFNRSLPDFLEKVTQEEATVCGKNPLSLLLALFDYGAFHQEVPYLIGYDTSRTKDADEKNSVSYVGLVFGKRSTSAVPLLTAYEKRSLIELAQQTIDNSSTHAISDELLCPIVTPALQKPAHLFFGNKKKSGMQLVSIEKPSGKDDALYLTVKRQAQVATVCQPVQFADLDDLASKLSLGGTGKQTLLV